MCSASCIAAARTLTGIESGSESSCWPMTCRTRATSSSSRLPESPALSRAEAGSQLLRTLPRPFEHRRHTVPATTLVTSFASASAPACIVRSQCLIPFQPVVGCAGANHRRSAGRSLSITTLARRLSESSGGTRPIFQADHALLRQYRLGPRSASWVCSRRLGSRCRRFRQSTEILLDPATWPRGK